jgi:ATP synthase protein I
MSGSTGSNGHGELSPDERKAFEQRAAELDKRLSQAGDVKSQATAHRDEARRSRALGQGMQMALDLVLGPVVGAGIGWGLDKVAGTSPVLLLIFLGIGIAAGITNLIRTYRQIQAEAGNDIGKDLPAGRDDGDDDNN